MSNLQNERRLVIMNPLFQSIENLKGVGKVRASKYKRLNIYTPYELFYHYPKSYINFQDTVSVNNAPLNEYVSVKCRVVKKHQEKTIRQNLTIFKASAVDDENTEFMIVFFNNRYMFDYIQSDREYYMYGKISENPVTMCREINSPQIVNIYAKNLIKPVYKLTEGLTNPVVTGNMTQALGFMDKTPIEILPSYIIRENKLMLFRDAMKNIHFPESMEMLERARYRLAFDELLKLQLGILMIKSRNSKKTSCAMKNVSGIIDLYNQLPFRLTSSQKNAVVEIVTNLLSPKPMNRLLQGDVGSGKTVVAACAIYYTCKLNGYQSALMAPTEILAVQHYNTISEFFKFSDIKVCLLTGSVPAKKKAEIKKKIASGEYSLVIGTHAIIQKDIEFKNLALVITDEQHRFGVAQRNALAMKGEAPNKLVMSATPIPRTLGLIIYGDLDISVLNELPEGRIPVKTYAVTSSARDRIFVFIKKFLDEGKQAYIVCPMIEDNENDLYSVISYAENIKKNDFKDYNVGLLHGKMSAAEKDEAMQKFKAGITDVLVCTTVIEVGVDVPNAVVMVIENCERFGLSQLHQLRGRVGRGREQSYCILVTDNLSDENLKRVKIMSTTSDGFKISEEDLKMRGPGDFFGEKQHGLPKLQLADMFGDMELVTLTHQIAENIIQKDPNLETDDYGALRIEIARLFSESDSDSFD